MKPVPIKTADSLSFVAEMANILPVRTVNYDLKNVGCRPAAGDCIVLKNVTTIARSPAPPTRFPPQYILPPADSGRGERGWGGQSRVTDIKCELCIAGIYFKALFTTLPPILPPD